MKQFFLFIILTGVFLFAGCRGTPNNPVEATTSNQNNIISLSKSGPHGPSVNGQATTTNTTTSVRRIITFHAATNSDGSVSGQGELHKFSPNPDLNYHFEFDINCLSVIDNVAIVSGIITRSTESFYPGRHFQFKVVDNGEGANAIPDQISNMANWANADPYPDCGHDVGWALFDIETGNIQIRQ